MPLQSGEIIEGEDAYRLLQDYALCPPSQRIQLKLLYPSYSAGMRHLLRQRGYHSLLREASKEGSSVLFSVDRKNLPTAVIKQTLSADGRNRGLAWDISINKLNSSTIADRLEDLTSVEPDQIAEPGLQRHGSSRWIMSFSSENEARRFVRAWHRRLFPLGRGDNNANVQAEFIW